MPENFINISQANKKNNVIVYEIMHKGRIVATISTTGRAMVYDEKFMSYDLYFDMEEDIDTLLNNLNNFYHWCASRGLSLDRQYAKNILNSIGVAQVVTDRDRAGISLSYHYVSLTDEYWVRKKDEVITFADVKKNLELRKFIRENMIN